MHAGGGVGGEFDPVGFEGMELRVDDGAGERDEAPVGAIGSPADETGLAF